MNAFEFQAMTRAFGDRVAVDSLTLRAGEGECLALLGVNGAGKTTAMRVLSGLIPPTQGRAFVMGHPAGSPEAKAALGVSPQETAVAGNLTARENLELMARVHGMSREDARRAAREQIDRMNLGDVEARRAGKLSGGWQRRLSIAMALVSHPRVLILDEPTLGLDVLARRELWAVLEELKKNTTLLLTTHYLEEAVHLADRIAILADGHLKAEGTAETLTKQAGCDTFEDAFVRLAGHGIE